MQGEVRHYYCWEIMQCNEEDPCPVRLGKIDRCWEWMERHAGFQCQYGLCAECIVYLGHNASPVLRTWDIEEILLSRDLLDQEGDAAFRCRVP